MPVYNVVFSEEERNEYSNLTLEMLKEGLLDTEIARNIGISPQTVKKLKEELIRNGKITQKEIDVAREEVKRKQDDEKEEEMKKVLQGLQEGKSNLEIAEEFSIEKTKVSKIKRKLIERGDITRRASRKISNSENG